MNFFLKEKQRLYLLTLIFLLAVLVRWLAIKDNKLTFWFDQSRDAYVATQIITNHDLKILGPSASGTNDTVYHGVLYYYFIAPFYYIGQGNPMIPALALSILGALGVFPLFYFSKSMFASEKSAWIAVFGYTISNEIIQLSHWLSNPSLAVMPLLVFYWSVWEAGYKNNKKFILPLAIALGVCLQSALWLICLLGPLLVAIIYNLKVYAKKSIVKNWQSIISFVLIVLLLVASIIFGQLMLFKNDVFTLGNMGSSGSTPPDALLQIVQIYFTKIRQSVAPALPQLSVVLVLAILLNSFRLKNRQKLFFITWFTAPFWLYAIEWRDSIHILISIEIAILMLFSWLIDELWQRKSFVLKMIALVMVTVFCLGNILTIHEHRVLGSNIFSFQQGTDLSLQLELINYTYSLADNREFSFSAFTNPNGYFITWAYLYNWYGKAHHSYLPTFVGPSQHGLFGEDLLARDDVSRNQIHFTIIEPNLNIVPVPIREHFAKEQDAIGPIVESKYFGSTLVQVREVKE